MPILELSSRCSRIDNCMQSFLNMNFGEVHRFIEYVISSKGILVDSQKVEIVKNWPKPISLLDSRSFPILACYYRRFIDRLSFITAPLIKLTQKRQIFISLRHVRRVLKS